MLLLDNSAWTRLPRVQLDEQRRADIGRLISEGGIATCLPFLLEAGYSARSARHHRAILSDLGLYPRVEITRDVERLALDAQSDLARVGHHRLRPTDILIAACAHEAGAGVLHYDRDYDVLREHTRLRFDSEWLAPAGSLD
ncbi:MAG TPA: PIN domain-containing protein [Conexibacter sp.]|jgi:predicted nucleic acid-binding protein|nr:PIN domain-containing protein [Conexibacter sp.]